MTARSRAERLQASADGAVTFDRLSIVGAAFSFALLGAVESVYGPLLQAIHERFHISVPVAGVTLTVHFVGASVGVVTGLVLLRRVPGRWLVSASALLAACGVGAVALSHSWLEFSAGVALTGVGFGVLDLTLNQLFSRTAIRGRAARITFMNGLFGLGALVGPLLVEGLKPQHFSALFGVYAAALAIVAVTMRGLAAAPTRGERVAGPRRSSGRERAITRALGVERRGVLVGFSAGFLVYVAVETSASGWIAAHLHGVGYASSVGSLVTAGFWAGMTLGRFGASLAGRYLRERVFVVGGLAVAVAFALGAESSAAAPVLYPLVGLMLAPVFPMALSWYTKLEPSSAHGVPVLLVASVVGGVIGPATESLVVSNWGIAVVPTVTAALALVTLCIFWGTARAVADTSDEASCEAA